MTDRPILFSPAMVRALLDGRKTQTRRVLMKTRNGTPVEMWPWRREVQVPFNDPCQWGFRYWDKAADCEEVLYLPEYARRYVAAVGDRLWVRERGAISATKGAFVPYAGNEQNLKAGSPAWPTHPAGTPYKPCPSIHMPRWASRLTLTVTDVRMQRVQEISEADAQAEGIERQDPTPEDWEWYRGWAEENGLDPDDPHGVESVWLAPGTRQGFGPRKDDPQWGPTPEFAYRLLWDSLNGKRDKGAFAWVANPWVVAVSFAVAQRNIGEVAA